MSGPPPPPGDVPRRRTARTLRRLTHPLSAAILVAALGLATAFITLALRGHFGGTPVATPLAAVTPPAVAAAPGPAAPAAVAPTPAAPSTSAALASGPQTVTGTVASSLQLPLSSDNADSVDIPAGTRVTARVTEQDGQVTLLGLILGNVPVTGSSGDNGKSRDGISGSTATETTLTVETSAGTVSLVIVQDSQVRGTAGDHVALVISPPSE